MENDRDPLAGVRATFNQVRAAAKELTPLIWTFFKALTEEGFTREEALTLTVEFMRKMVLPGKG